MTDDSSACRQAVPADQDRGPGLAAALQGFMPPGAAPVAQRAWMVGAWDGVRWSPPDDAAPWAQWRHLSTIVLDGGEAGRAHGESIWTTEVEGRPVGAAWEWIEWQPGVVILKDPMSIVSNLSCPVDDEDAPGPATSRVVALNTIAHALPWQDEVMRRLPRRASTRRTGTTQRTQRHVPEARRRVQ